MVSPLINGKDIIVLKYVESSLTDELLGSHYSQSALWSPLVRRFQHLPLAAEADDDGVDAIGCGRKVIPAKSPRTPKMTALEVKRRLFSAGSEDKTTGAKRKRKKKKKKLLDLSNIKKKINSLALNCALQKRKLPQNKDVDCLPRSPDSNGKRWEKALKMTSKQFKKKCSRHSTHTHRMTLADYLKLEDY